MSSANDSIISNQAAHDNFFIKAMSDLRVAKESLEQYLPRDFCNAIDLDSIEICKDRFHSVNLKGKYTDMLYRVSLKNFSEPAYIAALVEHQSTPRKNMPLRVFNYEAAIMKQHWERYKVVPLVYTIVYYNGEARWNYSRDLKDLIHAPKNLISRYALKPFQLVELNQISDEELRRSLWSGVMSLAMKHIYDRDILPALRSFIDLLKVLERQHGGDDYVLSLLYYLYKRGGISDENQFNELITTQLPSNIGEKTMTLAELHTQRGIQQGMQRGEQNKSRAIAINLLRMGLEPALVAKATGVDINIIKKILAAELQMETVK